MLGIGRIPYRAWLLAIFVLALAISAIRPPHPADFLFEHILTLALLGLLIALEKRGPLSNTAYTFIFLYMMLHVLGAHYTYSEVPYDQWCSTIFGTSFSDAIGAEPYNGRARNHFDRLVHFSFGLILLQPMSELVERWLGLKRFGRVIVAAAFICVLGTLYEELEWLYAAVMGAEEAERYNGQQGDMFDAQKDIALNISGAIIAGIVMGAAGLLRRK